MGRADVLGYRHVHERDETVYASLSVLAGVDDKLLNRPEVRGLVSVLENGELPEAIARSMGGSCVMAHYSHRMSTSTTLAVFKL